MKDGPTGLIKRMLQGDPACFDDITAWYADDVLRLCYGLLWDRQEAEDTFQEVLLRLIQTVKKGRFRKSNGSIKGFLMQTARNLCIDQLRKRVDFRSIDDTEIQRHSHMRTFHSPDRALDEDRFQTAFEESLAKLSDAQRTILVLSELNGESHQVIAAALNLSTDCVKTHLYRARKKMRILLEPYLLDQS